jgi:hypothetical protein
MNLLLTILGIIGPTELILILFIIVLILPIVALVDILRSKFEANDKLIWVILIVFIPCFGSILYFLIVTNKKIKNN